MQFLRFLKQTYFVNWQQDLNIFENLSALATSPIIYACRSKYSNRMRWPGDKGKQEITQTLHT